MNMPGLTAEVALDKMSWHYHMVGTLDALADRWRVLPQQPQIPGERGKFLRQELGVTQRVFVPFPELPDPWCLTDCRKRCVDPGSLSCWRVCVHKCSASIDLIVGM